MKNPKNKMHVSLCLAIGMMTFFASSCKKEDPIFKINPIITWANPSDITVGTLLSATQLNATADVAGAFVYTPAIGTTLALGTNQDLKVDFTPKDETSYNTASKTVKINVINGLVFGSMTDQEGNTYKTITIGTQTWMAENLKTTKYNDGSAIPNVTDNVTWVYLTTGAYCNYDNLESNIETYGRLYNWYAVNTGKLAPAGWHVPTDDDWTILENYLIANGYNYDGTKDVDKVAKSLCAKTNWVLSSEAGTPGAAPENNNSTGFTALPGGYRYYNNGYFYDIGKYGNWWSSTENSGNFAYYRYLYCSYKDLHRYNDFKEHGFSVRLVRD
jgi:uncharacterized protein (TIGR02145 family)